MGTAASEFGKVVPIPASSSTEKNCTRSVREGVGDSRSPSSEKVGDNGS